MNKQQSVHMPYMFSVYLCMYIGEENFGDCLTICQIRQFSNPKFSRVRYHKHRISKAGISYTVIAKHATSMHN